MSLDFFKYAIRDKILLFSFVIFTPFIYFSCLSTLPMISEVVRVDILAVLRGKYSIFDY